MFASDSCFYNALEKEDYCYYCFHPTKHEIETQKSCRIGLEGLAKLGWEPWSVWCHQREGDQFRYGQQHAEEKWNDN